MKDLQKKIEKLVPHDKALHHIGCEHIQVVTILVAYWFIGLWAIPLGWLICFALQLCKESFIDRYTTGFSWLDIMYGMTGCVPVSVIMFVLLVFK